MTSVGATAYGRCARRSLVAVTGMNSRNSAELCFQVILEGGEFVVNRNLKRITVTLGIAGSLAAVGCGDDAVTLDEFNSIEPGDTKADVDEQLGEPDGTSTVGRETLQWNYCADGRVYTINFRGDDVTGSQYEDRPDCEP